MATNGEDDHFIGYCKPPKHAQFAKGKSGNPKGRPKGSRNFSTLMRDELNVKIPIIENGHRRKITKQEAMAKQLANKGAAGDLKAIPMVMTEIRLREGLSGADQSEFVREEDQLVMENILKRIRETAAIPADSDAPQMRSTDLSLNPGLIRPNRWTPHHASARRIFSHFAQ